MAEVVPDAGQEGAVLLQGGEVQLGPLAAPLGQRERPFRWPLVLAPVTVLVTGVITAEGGVQGPWLAHADLRGSHTTVVPRRQRPPLPRLLGRPHILLLGTKLAEKGKRKVNTPYTGIISIFSLKIDAGWAKLINLFYKQSESYALERRAFLVIW